MYAMLHLASIFGGTSAYGGISWWNADSSAGCLLSVKNCIYYELKESIFIKVDDLFLYRKEEINASAGKYHLKTCMFQPVIINLSLPNQSFFLSRDHKQRFFLFLPSLQPVRRIIAITANNADRYFIFVPCEFCGYKSYLRIFTISGFSFLKRL